MIKVKGTLADAYGFIPFAKEKEARPLFFTALGLKPISRPSFRKYMEGEMDMKASQILACKLTLEKYGIKWIPA